jgi:hypothetical protein
MAAGIRGDEQLTRAEKTMKKRTNDGGGAYASAVDRSVHGSREL